MKTFSSKLIPITTFCLLFGLYSSCTINNTKTAVSKEIYFPKEIYMVSDSNDYNNPESEYCYQRMVEDKDVAIFWHKEYGLDPMINTDTLKRFNVHRFLSEYERIFNYYVDTLKMIEKGNSLTDKYKMLVYIFGGDEGTAFGGGAGDSIGIFWTPALRIHKEPYGALAHELGHSFQYISKADTKQGPDGPIMEMSAQYMLWQVYPEWMTFENYHLIDYLKGTHYAFLHPQNMYHSPYVLEYWSEKHGKDFHGKLLRNSQEGEDPVATYKRITNISQEQFNDEMYEAAAKFMTWDLSRVDSIARQYANMHYTKLIEAKNGWYKVAPQNCPQNYGYNGIQLIVPTNKKEISIDFKGIAGAEGYRTIQTKDAGWRYGFVAFLKNGQRVYSPVNRDKEATVSFSVPENTQNLWFVVTGAPQKHWNVKFDWEKGIDENSYAQWPYAIKLHGTDFVS